MVIPTYSSFPKVESSNVRILLQLFKRTMASFFTPVPFLDFGW